MNDLQKKAVVLVSGGLDSATVLAMAADSGRECHALSFDYGQRHRAELAAAAKIAKQLGAVEHRTVSLDLRAIGGSALTDDSIAVPVQGSEGIPATYVPARNTVFLSIALGWAEVLDADEVHVGVNAVDFSGYPDCRPEFIEAFQQLADVATRRAVEGRSIQICAPLLQLGKDEIIRRGVQLGVDFALTISCYSADGAGRACGKCDSCRLRHEGFSAAGVADPTLYA